MGFFVKNNVTEKLFLMEKFNIIAIVIYFLTHFILEREANTNIFY